MRRVDSIRAARREGVRVDTWQFDELLGQVVRSGGRGYREFLRGVLAGLTFGRPQLNDREERGFVWSPLGVLELASVPTDSELATFWLQLDRSCFRVAGEEYPRFAILARPPPPRRVGNACSRDAEPPAARSPPSIWRG